MHARMRREASVTFSNLLDQLLLLLLLLLLQIGHWMGLVHTWDGGCQPSEAETDQVDDTPAENHPTKWGVDMKDASSGCRVRDSCGNLPGQDMYENYMTYNNLACARSFTAGQQARMLYLFRAVRKDRR
jgi:hypothetical protein